MPIHVGDNHDRGGNDTQVRFFDKGTNMHKLWDTDMIERVSKDEEFWLKDLATLDSPQALAEAGKDVVEDWATESLLAARAAYVVPQIGGRIKPGQKLGALYFDEQLPVVRHRLYQAGARLAKVLNECFADYPR